MRTVGWRREEEGKERQRFKDMFLEYSRSGREM